MLTFGWHPMFKSHIKSLLEKSVSATYFTVSLVVYLVVQICLYAFAIIGWAIMESIYTVPTSWLETISIKCNIEMSKLDGNKIFTWDCFKNLIILSSICTSYLAILIDSKLLRGSSAYWNGFHPLKILVRTIVLGLIFAIVVVPFIFIPSKPYATYIIFGNFLPFSGFFLILLSVGKYPMKLLWSYGNRP